MSLRFVRDTLDRHGLRLKRDLGQNFLVEEGLADRLALLSGVEAGDCVIEVGTGLGVLTRALARRVERVATIEIDSGLVSALREDALLPDNVELMHADALEVDLRSLARDFGRRPVRVVANLPYSVASPLLRKLLDLRHDLVDWSVMLQRELGVRLVAEPGSGDYGSLTVLHRLVAHVSREMDLRPGCFFPAPKVESSFLRVFPREDSPLEHGELPEVERVVRALFNQRRKTILNGLRAAGLPASSDKDALLAALASVDVDARQRAEKLEPEVLLALARRLRG